MGEAKRRKLTGNYPDGGRAEEFRVPTGKLAITVDIDDHAPSTVMFDADKVTDLVAMLDRDAKQRGLDYYAAVRFIGSEFPKLREQGANLSGIGLIVLWTAFYHPTGGPSVRANVSRCLRQTGKAHISWKYSKTFGLAIAIAEQFADLDKLIQHAPRDRQTTIEFPQEPEKFNG